MICLEEDIITFKEEAIVVLEEEKLWKIIGDSRYEPIFQALREGPMTVKDLTKKYNQIIYDFIEGLELSAKDKKQKKTELERVEKTIYKYLNILQKEKLIVKAGKRIQVDETGRITQAASENLYGRIAKLYLFSFKEREYEKIPEFHTSVPIIGKILSLMNNLPEPSEECLSKVMIKIFKDSSKKRKELFEKHSEELAEVSSEASYEIMKSVVESMDFLNSILIQSEFQEELRKCFKK
ncbi:MAG: hypothetical protein ACW96U_09970 [Candidatus Heimdallarchaeaceae archaeon]